MLRFATENDIPAMLAVYGPYVLTSTATFEYTVPTPEAFLQRFRACTRQFPWLVWEEDGRVLGYAYGSAPFDRAAWQWCAEVSIYLDPRLQRRGVGKKLYEALEDLLLRQGYRIIYAVITSENTSSIAFHEAMGYRKTAAFPDCGLKFGRWLGVVWMEKRVNFVDIPRRSPDTWRNLG